MRRVLLCLEDYNELLFLETLLKKIGFDVESIRNETSLSEKIMGFSPDLVVATGDGHKVNGARVAQKIKKGRTGHTRLLLVFPRQKMQQEKVSESFACDGAIESPLNPRSIITSICQLTGVPAETILSKFEKLPIAKDYPQGEGFQIVGSRMAPQKKASGSGPIHGHSTSDHFMVSGGNGASGTHPAVTGNSASGWASAQAKSATPRKKHYDDLLKSAPQSQLNGFQRQFVQKEVKEIRKDEDRYKEIDEERKKFVVELFKKK